MNPLVKAQNRAAGMYSTALAHSKQVGGVGDILRGTGDGLFGDSIERLDMAGAQEQYNHFRGWVYAAIRPICQRIAACEIRVGRATKQRSFGSKQWQVKESLPLTYKAMGDQVEPLDAHPILSLLADPNDLQTAWSLIYVTIANLELTGQSLWLVNDDRTEVIPVPSHWIKKRDVKARVWWIQPPRMVEPYSVPEEDTVYLSYPDPSDPLGVLSPLQAAARAVETDEQIQIAQHTFFRRGINGKTVIHASKMEGVNGMPGMRPRLTPDQRTQLIEAIKGAYGGVRNWNEPLIVDGLIDQISTLGKSVAEMDFQASGSVTKSRIFQIFGVNPIIAGEIENANRAQAAVAESNFCELLNAKVELISQCLTEWLAPMFARPSERLVVWLSKCVPNDPELKEKQYTLGLTKGAITINEWRRYHNLPDVPWGDDPLPQSQPQQMQQQVASPAADDDEQKHFLLENRITGSNGKPRRLILNPY